jgi:hypothetical protein
MQNSTKRTEKVTGYTFICQYRTFKVQNYHKKLQVEKLMS